MNRIEIIKKVLSELNEQDVSYCILRNYDFLLENRMIIKHSERSIDLVVSVNDLNNFDKVLREHDFRRRKNLSYSKKHHPYFKIAGTETISFDVQIGGVHWNDMCYLGEEHILKNRIKKEFFYIPSDNDIFVMLLVHSILGKRYFKPEYHEVISSLSPTVNRNYVLQRLAEIFNKKTAEELLDLSYAHKFDEIMKKKYSLIIAFIFKSHENMRTFIPLFMRWVKWKKILQPYPLISFIGPDGSGKSTMAKELEIFLKKNNRKTALIYTGRGRNQILPFRKIGNLYKGKERAKDRQTKPKSSTLNKRKLIYTLAAPVFTVDLLLRYAVRMLLKRRAKQIVITDRYSSDILLMENVPFSLKKLLLQLFPKPTLTFYLYNSPGELNARRPEESIEGLEKQMFFFDKLKPHLNPIEIKTTNKEKDREQIIKTVMGYLYDNWY